MQKKIFAVAVFALAFAVAFSASAYDLGSTTLKVGSTGPAVVAMQEALNACTGSTLSKDGKFGPMTTTAVKAFQTSKGKPADGLVGPITKAALNSCGTTASTNNPSTSTSSVPGCAVGAAFSSTTGQACVVATWGTSTAEGYISDIASDAANRVSTVYEAEADKVVIGFRATAKLADQKVEKATVTFKNGNSADSSANLGKYISSVSLWNGSTKIASMAVSSADRSTSDDTYTFNFTGLSSIISKDTTGRFYVSVNANGALDSGDTDAAWTVKVTEIRATSPNGVYVSSSTGGTIYVGTDATTGGLSFGKFSDSGVKVTATRASSSPIAYTKEVSKSTTTNGVKLLDFNVKAEVSPITLRNVPITITSATTQSTFINNLKLMKGDQVVADIPVTSSTTNTTWAYKFINLSSGLDTVNAGSTATYSVVADFKSQGASYGNYANGVTVSAKITDVASGTWSVIDSNGDQVVTRSGSANGYDITLASEGASAALVSSTYAAPVTGDASQDGTISITFNVTAFGTDVVLADDGTDLDYTLTGSTETDAVLTIDGLTAVSGDFTIAEGETKKVTLALKHNTVTGFVKLAVDAVDGTDVSNIVTANY